MEVIDVIFSQVLSSLKVGSSENREKKLSTISMGILLSHLYSIFLQISINMSFAIQKVKKNRN